MKILLAVGLWMNTSHSKTVSQKRSKEEAVRESRIVASLLTAIRRLSVKGMRGTNGAEKKLGDCGDYKVDGDGLNAVPRSHLPTSTRPR